jgi:hypothetical protein
LTDFFDRDAAAARRRLSIMIGDAALISVGILVGPITQALSRHMA